jgi:hypothetical protein
MHLAPYPVSPQVIPTPSKPSHPPPQSSPPRDGDGRRHSVQEGQDIGGCRRHAAEAVEGRSGRPDPDAGEAGAEGHGGGGGRADLDAGEARGDAEGTQPQRGVLREGGAPGCARAAEAGEGNAGSGRGGGRARVPRAGARCWRRGQPEPRQAQGRSQAAGKVQICNIYVFRIQFLSFYTPTIET